MSELGRKNFTRVYVSSNYMSGYINMYHAPMYYDLLVGGIRPPIYWFNFIDNIRKQNMLEDFRKRHKENDWINI